MADAALIATLETQIRAVEGELIRLAQQTPYSAPLVSLKGVSDLLAALFIAELRDPSRFPRPKQIERLAGYTLHVCDLDQPRRTYCCYLPSYSYRKKNTGTFWNRRGDLKAKAELVPSSPGRELIEQFLDFLREAVRPRPRSL